MELFLFLNDILTFKITQKASTYLGNSPLGFPNLIDSEQRKPTYFMHLGMSQSSPPPKEDQPSTALSYSQTAVIEYFRQDDTVREIPKTYKDLQSKHFPVAISYLELYPGSAGLKLTQFKFLRNNELKLFNKEGVHYKDDWLTVQAMSSSERIQYFKWENWASDYSQYIEERGSFIENRRDGYGGPIISYYARHSDSNGWFS